VNPACGRAVPDAGAVVPFKSVSLLHATDELDPPTPDPCSTVIESSKNGAGRNALAAALEEGRRLYGSETGDAWFAALSDGTHPLCRIATPGHDGGAPQTPHDGGAPQTPGRADADRPRLTEADLVTAPAMLEAAALYAGDLTPDRELADALAGRHPLQRPASLAR
jgi:hypothetical protein